ncbi:MAG: oligosaccharide flippase family protein [Candidatus Levyibacteriota bacterium]
MQDFDESGSPHFETIARKSVKGLFALVSRTFFIQLLSVFASFILTIFLDPASFGIFFVVSAIVVFLNYFQDIGLAASLIQKKQEPTLLELRTTFTVQQVLVLSVSIPTAVFAPQIAAFYKLDHSGLMLLYALIASFVMSSLKTIPTILLERRLDFNKLVIPQIAENFVYNICLIVFAVLGFKVQSFTIAVLARSVIGLVLIYIIEPWPVGLAYDLKVLKRLLSFGVPFQANSFLALLKDDLFDVYVAKVLPLTQVGYIGFGQKWAFMPLRLFMDNVVKITFPSFSRLQHDPAALRKAIEKTLFLISVCMFPVVVSIVLFSPYLVSFIPKYKKWEPAILSLTFFSLSTILSSLSTPLTNILSAIGKVRITLYFMVLWTALTWIISPLFIFWFGYNGVAIASFLISFSSVLVFAIARSFIEFSMIKPVIPAGAAAIAMSIFALFTQHIAVSFPLLVLEMMLSLMFYALVLYGLARGEIHRTLKFIKSSIR